MVMGAVDHGHAMGHAVRGTRCEQNLPKDCIPIPTTNGEIDVRGLRLVVDRPACRHAGGGLGLLVCVCVSRSC